ncbi:MAG: DUF4097 domain-containing protein [Acidobacteriota bacterium]|nr:DUF4097 domain-containing protein [Acidobacteriota bacterium]
MRHQKLRILALALTASALFGVAAQAVTLKEKFEQTYPLSGGGRLALENVNGAVTIEGWDRGEVRVEAVKQVRAGSDEEAKRLMSQLIIQVDQSGGGLHITTRMPRQTGGSWFGWFSGKGQGASVEYRLEVPRHLELSARNVNGDVSLSGTSGKAGLETTNGAVTAGRVVGDLRLSTTNGAIKIMNAAGSVKAESTNGGIEAALGRVEGTLSAETTNGSISIRLPGNVRASLDAETSNGSIETDFAVQGGKSSRRHLTGDVNGGGGKVTLSTTNGGIRIVKQ